MTPLTLQALKSALVIRSSADDSTLTQLLADAIAVVEQRTGRAIARASLVEYREDFRRDIQLPAVPVASVSSVSYVDDDTGDEITIADTDWYTTQVQAPFVTVRFTSTFAPAKTVRRGTVKVSYVAGSTAMPNGIVRAITALVGHWYNNPEAAQPIELRPVPASFEMIMDAYSVKGCMA